MQSSLAFIDSQQKAYKFLLHNKAYKIPLINDQKVQGIDEYNSIDDSSFLVFFYQVYSIY